MLTRKQAIEKARRYVEKRSDGQTGGRKWLVGTFPDCFGDSRYRVEAHVCEGSPPKGFVLVGRERVVAMDGWFEYSRHWDFNPTSEGGNK
jgi:hypothetical protein